MQKDFRNRVEKFSKGRRSWDYIRLIASTSATLALGGFQFGLLFYRV